MSDIIKIICPRCGSVLSVKNQSDLANTAITCPVCKGRFPFTQFRIGSRSEEKGTAYGLNKKSFIIGKIEIPSFRMEYQLKVGKNIIGRKADSSSADFQIPCNDRRMSREHLLIEVSRDPKSGYIHNVSLCKENVNPTNVGKMALEWGDELELADGMVIHLPEVDAIFRIPDEEGTII